jgi:hypothetical protein
MSNLFIRKRFLAAMCYTAAFTLTTVVVFLIGGGNASAQSVYGSIVGTATDSTGSAVPGAGVTLTNLATNEARSAQTDGSGNYTFVNLQPGTYGIAVGKDGFKKLSRQPIEIQVNSEIRVDAALQVGDMAQTVEVSAQTPLLQTQNATIGHEIEQIQVEELALNGRDVFNLIALAPGVVPQGSTMTSGATVAGGASLQYQMGGGTAGQSAAYVDGAPINQTSGNGNPWVPVQDAVQEFRVSTSDTGPEFGRYAGGIVNMSTKSGTNVIHGTLYEYLRNQDFNANSFFNNRNGLKRAVYQQNEYGATVGGPIKKDRTFAFLSWEQIDLRQASTTSTTVPTLLMRTGDFSQVQAKNSIFDPLTTALNSNGGYARTPFAGNKIPDSRINHTALTMENLLFPLPTNAGTSTNFVVNTPKPNDANEYLARLDHRVSDRDQLFARFGLGNNNYASSSALLNTGTGSKKGVEDAVLGNTFTISPTTVLDVRAHYLRALNFTAGLSQGMDMSVFGPAWAQYNHEMTVTKLPTPNIIPDNNFNGSPVINNVENIFTLSGSVTKIIGRHTLKFGGEARRYDQAFYQSNSIGSTYTFDSGFTSQFPLLASGAGSPASSGYGTASFLLGFPSAGSASEPGQSYGTNHYYGVFINDSFRVNKKLTLSLGLRGESPGAFKERYNSLNTWDPNLPQTALASATGLPIIGGLVLDGSPQRPNRSWQDSKFLFAPRIGLAYSLSDSLVVRAGYGIADLPINVSFGSGPYNVPSNLAVTNMLTSLDGGLTPDLATTLSNPFPSGIQRGGPSQAYVNSLIGQGISAPVANQAFPYLQTWNLDVQKQFGGGLVLETAYMGGHGVHLPFYDINTDQIPDQYLSMGNALLTPVKNPFYGVIPATTGLLGQPTIGQGYLLKPYPQYLYTTVLTPTIGNSYYESWFFKAQKRFAGGVLLGSYTYAHLRSDVDVLNPWSEQNRYGVGGGEGVQDNTNTRGGEGSLSSFDVPHRVVLSFVRDLPFGAGHKFLSSAHGLPGKLVSGWSANGITIFQTGFPIAFQDAAPNLLETDFAIGNGGPGPPGAGVSRPNYTPGCNTAAPDTSTLQAHLAQWFNTSCFALPGPWQFGNEPRVDPNLRSAGVNNTDFAISKKTAITERATLVFRAEAFNIFNRVQWTEPNPQPGSATFGQITSQANQPRILQFALRLTY